MFVTEKTRAIFNLQLKILLLMKQKIHYIYLLLQSINEQATTSLKAVPKIEPGVTPPVKPAEATTNNGSIAAASSTPDVKPTGKLS